MPHGPRLSRLLTAILSLVTAMCCPAGATAQPQPAVPGTVVFMLNGAGGFEIASRAVRETIEQDGCPICVETFNWTHGYWRIIADQCHGSHTRAAGHRLAEQVLAWREEHPGQRICLMGHSAGCAVVLAAAESLPPCTLARVILLAPAVSVKHDLRPALAAACEGIDVFYSEHDWACLGIGVALAGTADRHWTTAAGRRGFPLWACCGEDAALFLKLRQYPWNPSLSCVGHRGGHYGSYQPDFLRAFVLPLLCPPSGGS
jgi:pimeloyl-ACP methyl ester carboxylesterase